MTDYIQKILEEILQALYSVQISVEALLKKELERKHTNPVVPYTGSVSTHSSHDEEYDEGW